MSKINAVRIINLNYNNNAIRVSDETFHLNGESTLISLRNGGGKSVLVQMMMAPFLHKRYRDIKDRPFESYFTTNKPTFIMVEWILEQGAGYVLTGMMVRKNQEVLEDHEEQRERLEIINFISEHSERCMQDIHHLPVVERVKKEITLKGFGACRQLFESYKRDRTVSFFYYDMGNQAQQKQYFDKLAQYQIYYKEWETIIKKVNIKESGLSDLFADCKDEKGLVEKWFLDAVESKLNKDKNRMKEFQSIVEKYVGQYKDNKSKIQRRDTIRRFQEEAEKIAERATQYETVTAQMLSYENQIAVFIKEVEQLRECEEKALEEIRAELEDISQKRLYLEYEELSKEYYEWKQQELYHCGNMEMIGAERDALEAECQKIEKALHLMQCAKEQELVGENRRDMLYAKQKLLVATKEDEILEPERESIGYTLKHYYESQCEEWAKKKAENETDQVKITDEISDGKNRLAKTQSDIMEETKEIAGKRERIHSFDEREDAFNRQYGEKFIRNIMGEYEPGMLDIQMSSLQTQLAQTERERTTLMKTLDDAGEQKKASSRLIENRKQTQVKHRLTLQSLEQSRTLYENELKERRTVMKYLDIAQDAIFDTDRILSDTSRKLGEIERVRRGFEKEEEILQQEYIRLTQGKVLELPEDFQQLLEQLGLNYVYGMEWLKKNGYTTKDNQQLVKRYPFLPYALLLSGQDMDRLLSYMGNGREEAAVYTSFPIPIIMREQLDKETATDNAGIISFQGIQFYVAFNGNLLDEGKLRQMIAEKETQIKKIQSAIAQKKVEHTDYFEKHERIRNQKITKKDYEENLNLIASTKEEIGRLEEQIREQEEVFSNLGNQIEEHRKRIQSLGVKIDKYMGKAEELKRFSIAYTSYMEEKRELARHEKQAERLQEQLCMQNAEIEKFQNKLFSLQQSAQDILHKSEKLKEKFAVYAEFDKVDMVVGEPEELEARYTAITAGLSSERKELERQVEECSRRFSKSVEELAYLVEKYQLEEMAWEGIIYNRKEEQHQEVILEDKEKKVQVKTFQYNEEDKAIAVLRQQLEGQIRKLKERCQKDEPLAKEEIKIEDFKAQRNQLIYAEKEKRKQGEQVGEKVRVYENNLTSLAEYSNLEVAKEVVWEADFSSMNRKELDNFKGTLIRDYRQEVSKRQDCKKRLADIIDDTLRIKEFSEEFFRKPLESLRILAETEEAAQTMAQLDTTIQSYNSLIKKLEVDISVVEKEKEKIVELLLDYIKEVHGNLGKIDYNSTITIRERPVKMLKINLPDWDENEAIFEVRLQDYIAELTQKGIEIFEANENAQEYFGTRITTKHLYDTVIGIGNVQIRLYKIEEMREYPITWADVARNSGGEGFLSAFVILSSLLYYMRRDDSDLFADRNEGKVLVMDNPFAQTNAAHLLKPLMDMAKKANTQLICLSGLGGESIYNRFDNIYVLNLIAASLRSGMQYLKTEHTKGAEQETVIASRIEVVQQELLF